MYLDEFISSLFLTETIFALIGFMPNFDEINFTKIAEKFQKEIQYAETIQKRYG